MGVFNIFLMPFSVNAYTNSTEGNIKIFYTLPTEISVFNIINIEGTGNLQTYWVYDSNFNIIQGAANQALPMISEGSQKYGAKYLELTLKPDTTVTNIILKNGSSTLHVTGDNFTETSPFPPPPPNMVSQIVAIPVSNRSIKISWIEPNDISFQGVEISDGTNVYKVGKGQTELLVENLQPNTRYDFIIRSYNDDSGLKSQDQGFFATTLEINTVPPLEIINLQSTIWNDRIKFTWENPDDIDFHEVRIYRDGKQIATAVTPATSFIDYDLQEHTTYTFVFFSVNTDGYKSEGISVTETTKGIPRGSVKGLKVITGVLTADYYFSFNPDATSYNIYLDNILYDSINENYGTLTDLEDGKHYELRVSAVNEFGESELSSPFVFTATLPDQVIPNFRSLSPMHDSVRLLWDSVGAGTIYRIVQNNIEVASTSSIFYTLTDLIPETTYFFKLVYTDQYGREIESGVLSLTTKKAPEVKPPIVPSPAPPISNSNNEDLNKVNDELAQGIKDIKDESMKFTALIIALILVILGCFWYIKIMKKKLSMAVSKRNTPAGRTGAASPRSNRRLGTMQKSNVINYNQTNKKNHSYPRRKKYYVEKSYRSR